MGTNAWTSAAMMMDQTQLWFTQIHENPAKIYGKAGESNVDVTY